MTSESIETTNVSENDDMSTQLDTLDQYDTEQEALYLSDTTVVNIQHEKLSYFKDETGIKGFQQMECKKSIENIYISNYDMFFSYKKSVYKNSVQIIKNSNKSKIIHMQLHGEDVLVSDEKSFLKYFSVLKKKYLIVRDYKLKGEIKSIGISPTGKEFIAINDTHLFLMKAYSSEVKEIKHNLKIKGEAIINYLEDVVLIQTKDEINLFVFSENGFKKIFRLEKVLGKKILAFSFNKNIFALLTDKYILLNERVVNFSGGRDCKLFNNQLFVSTETSIIVFSLNLRQVFIYKHLCKGFRFQTNFEIKGIEIEKVKNFFKLFQTICIEKIVEIENQLTNLCIQQRGSIIKRIKKFNTDGILIFSGTRIFVSSKKLNTEEAKKTDSLFYKEKLGEENFLETQNKKLFKGDFLINRCRYSQALECLLDSGDTNRILKYLREFRKKGVLKFIFKEKGMRNGVIEFFLTNKTYLLDTGLFVYILDYLFVEYEIDYEREALKGVLDSLYGIHVDACLIYGYLESKL